MKTMMKMTAAAFALTLMGTFPLSGQTVVVPEQECEAGVITGSLGISGLDCVGECSVNISRGGKEQNWVFSTEPRVFSLESGGPAEGILRAGDYLVAIDGVLITTREGGRRYADLEPGEIVTIRYRRDGNVHEAGIRVGSWCRPVPEPTAATGRVASLPPLRPSRAVPPVGIATAPRVTVLPDLAEPASPMGIARAAGVSGYFRNLMTTRGRLGIGLTCTECGSRSDEETGENIWFFSGPIEVTQVNSGGPAERAGIRMGDLITAIDGHDIATEAGGLAFSTLTPGEAVQVRVVRRNGREEDVSLVPSGPDAEYLRGRPAPPPTPDEARPARPTSGVAPLAEPRAPSRGEMPTPTTGMTGPENLPMTYSGTVAGVEVLVRGGPVAVSEFRGTRTIIINSDGLWIRIRVPAGSTSPGDGGMEPS